MYTDNFPIMRADLRYGKGNGTILLDDLMCKGGEESLLECDPRRIWENDCDSDHSEDAGVICSGKARPYLFAMCLHSSCLLIA